MKRKGLRLPSLFASKLSAHRCGELRGHIAIQRGQVFLMERTSWIMGEFIHQMIDPCLKCQRKIDTVKESTMSAPVEPGEFYYVSWD